MKFENAIIIGADLIKTKDKQSGMPLEFTKVYYTLPREKTANNIGATPIECFIGRNIITKLERLIERKVTIEVEVKPTDNNKVKLVLKTVDGNVL